jgi:hypothetical protein
VASRFSGRSYRTSARASPKPGGCGSPEDGGVLRLRRRSASNAEQVHARVSHERILFDQVRRSDCRVTVVHVAGTRRTATWCHGEDGGAVVPRWWHGRRQVRGTAPCDVEWSGAGPAALRFRNSRIGSLQRSASSGSQCTAALMSLKSGPCVDGGAVEHVHELPEQAKAGPSPQAVAGVRTPRSA